jgi:RNase P subunit RPR2
MKIISRGILPEEFIYRVTCSNCKTYFEFQRSEGKVTYDQRDGSFVTVECPVCQHSVHADLNNYIKETNTEPRPIGQFSWHD